MIEGKITIEGDRPETPQQKADVLMALTRAISDDPAEGVMLLLVCACRIAVHYSGKPRLVQLASLRASLELAAQAVDDMWPDEANDNEPKETLQ